MVEHKCPDCNNTLFHSKLELYKYICKHCNNVYMYDDLKNNQKTLLEYGEFK